MATQYVFKGFDVVIVYNFPVAPGQSQDKQRIKVADNIPTYKQAREVRDQFNALLADMTASWARDVAENPALAAWSPFAGGTIVEPDWDKIEVP